MYIQQDLSAFNIGDIVEMSEDKSESIQRGAIKGYNLQRFSVSKELNSMGLKPGIYIRPDGLIVEWKDSTTTINKASDLVVVKPEYRQKPRLTKARLDALGSFTRVSDLPVLKIGITDVVAVDGNSGKRYIVADIDYIAAIEKDFNTGNPRDSVAVREIGTDKETWLPLESLTLLKKGPVSYFKDWVDGKVKYMSMESVTQFLAFVEATGYRDFIKSDFDGVYPRALRSPAFDNVKGMADVLFPRDLDHLYELSRPVQKTIVVKEVSKNHLLGYFSNFRTISL